MFEKIIEFSMRNRMFIILLTLVIVAWGAYSIKNTPVDAIPDLSDTQVIVYSTWAGQSPQEIEDQLTYPLTSSLLGVPKVENVRGFSFFGFSLVYVIFKDGTDLYWARSRVLENLNTVQSRLPKDATVQLGPDATGVGWVYMYTVESKNHTMGQLKALQDWYIKYELMTVPGISEVASVGGYDMQYQVNVIPEKLRDYNIPLKHVVMQIKKSNEQAGGRLLEMAGTEYMIRGLGYVKNLDDLRNVVLKTDNKGVPVRVKDVAHVTRGPDIRRGVADKNGQGEVVIGVVIIRFGENARDVIAGVKKKLIAIKSGLPKGVKIVPGYDRSKLINYAVDNLKEKLTEQMIVIAMICLVFLVTPSSSFVALITLPLGIMISFIFMHAQGLNSNIMSLGGIAIALGTMVDASFVMVENAHKKIENDDGSKPRFELLMEAAKEVGPSLFFSLIIITVSFLPILTLQKQEGRLFRPLAFTKTYAMFAGAILALTIVPVLMTIFIPRKVLPEKKHPLSNFLIWVYKPILGTALRFKGLVIIIAIVVLLITLYPMSRIGSEFMPPLNELDILYMPTTFPGISIQQAKEMLIQQDKIIKKIPEVETVLGKLGRADSATDPAPLSMVETTVILKDPSKWRKGVFIEDIMEELDKSMQMPGVTNAWTMPIKTRIDMQSTGIKTPVGIKVYGQNLKQIMDLAMAIEREVVAVPGTRSAFAERVLGGNYLDIDIDRKEIARYGLTIDDVQQVIKSGIGGMNISTTVEGRERFPIQVRYASAYRDNLESLRQIPIITPSGAQVPLGNVASIKIKKGPAAIKSEDARLQSIVFVDLKRGVDVGTYVKEAKKYIKKKLVIPKGATIEWSGQYEYMQRANKRLSIVIPITLFIIFTLLYLNFKNITDTFLVLVSLPFAIMGGIWFMYFSPQIGQSVRHLISFLASNSGVVPWVGQNLQDFFSNLPPVNLGKMNFSIASGVGFIAVAGLSAETGVIVLVYLNMSYKKYVKEGRMLTVTDLFNSIIDGAVMRIRPILMTVISDFAGLIPLFFGFEAGSRVMIRISGPLFGGIITSAATTLVLVPVLFAFIKSFEVKKRQKEFIEKYNKAAEKEITTGSWFDEIAEWLKSRIEALKNRKNKAAVSGDKKNKE
ncbi:MAG: efflux RND transporter permease subunit [Deltaproteobacteria bacterium]|nr:efflux RND transporter permease subunit [Deltaproteobacteria bacterium]